MPAPLPCLVQPGGLMRDKSENEIPRSESPEETSLEPLLKEIRQKHGDALLAILVYGSWLRGKRDTMLDFYVLVEDYRTLDSSWQGWMCKLLPPNVYHIHHKAGYHGTPGHEPPSHEPPSHERRGHELRAKYALLTLNRFHNAMQHDFHSYFWARFAQPCEVLYVRDQATRAVLTGVFKSAAATFVRRVLPAMGDRFSSRELWTRGLSLTYQCELRTESSNRGESIYEFNPSYFDGVTNTFAEENTVLSKSETGDIYQNQCSTFTRKFSPLSWWLRRVQGKLLSMQRLLKAAFTFNEPLEYLLWKIERHSGIHIEPTERQLKHPLIFAWPLLWKLYRQGAFR
jgi:hypothetical protein